MEALEMCVGGKFAGLWSIYVLLLADGGQVKFLLVRTTVIFTVVLHLVERESALLSAYSHVHGKQTIHATLKCAGACCVLSRGEGDAVPVSGTGRPGDLLQHCG